MFGVALLMCMIVALGGAHVYERCELARELASLGVDKEHIATWVCIAYHESRFDTAARNHGSGDHGLLQISELYWCGPGKACGVPCTAFRDEDISDDVECAQKIYKEHTRLQGDGFLAWVVYPLHCKHNAKKYLAECKGSIKNGTENIESKARSLKSRIRNMIPRTFQSDYLDTNRPKPSYLAISTFFERSFSNEFEKNNEIENWLDVKIGNVDSLKLPVKNIVENQFLVPQSISTASKSTITSTKTDHTKSPYLAIKTLVEGNYYKQFLENNKHLDWLDYKVENIDSLKLPVFNNNGEIQYLSPPMSLTSYKAPSIAKSTNIYLDKSTVPYLNIKSLFEGNYFKQFQENYKQRTNWLDYKIDNVDSLKLPVTTKNGNIQLIAPSTSYIKLKSTTNTTPRSRITSTTKKPTTTTVDPALIGIKPPMPRKIESNQFRRKKILSDTNFSNHGLTQIQIGLANTKNNLPLTPESSSQTATQTTMKSLLSKSNTSDIYFSVTSSPHTTKQIFNHQNIQPIYTNTPSSSTISPVFNWSGLNKTPFFEESLKNKSLTNGLNINYLPTEQTTVKNFEQLFTFASHNYYTTSRPFSVYSSRTPSTVTTKVFESIKVTIPLLTNYNKNPGNNSSAHNISSINSVATRKPIELTKELTTTKPSTIVTKEITNYNPPFSNRFSYVYQNNPSSNQQVNSVKNVKQPSLNNTNLLNLTNTFASPNYSSTTRPFNFFNSYSSQTPDSLSTRLFESVKLTTPRPINYNKRPESNFPLQNISAVNYIKTQTTTNLIKNSTTMKPPLSSFVTKETFNYHPFSNIISNPYQNNQSINQHVNSVNKIASNNTNNILNLTSTFASRNYYTTAKPFNLFNSYSSQKPVTATTKVAESVKAMTPSPINYNKNFGTVNSVETQKPINLFKDATTTKPPLSAFVTKDISNYNRPFSNRFSNTYPNNLPINLQTNNVIHYSSNSTKSGNLTSNFVTSSKNKANTSINLNVPQTKYWPLMNNYSSTSKPQTARTSWQFSPFTFKPVQTTPFPTVFSTISPVNKSSILTQNATKYISTTNSPEIFSKSTPSIFDLYLRPQKFTLPPFQFSPFNTSLHKVQIFSGGTTGLPKS